MALGPVTYGRLRSTSGHAIPAPNDRRIYEDDEGTTQGGDGGARVLDIQSLKAEIRDAIVGHRTRSVRVAPVYNLPKGPDA